MNPLAGIGGVAGGMTYFWGVLRSSVRNQPLMSAGAPVELYTSMASPDGGSSFVSTSLISTAGRGGGGGSTRPGEPPAALLGRQSLAEFPPLVGASTATSENPSPSVAGYQLVS